MDSRFKTKAEEIRWRRSKILELKSQGLEQIEIAQTLMVSPATITVDLNHLRQEAIENIKNYTTRELPIQFKATLVATQNAIKQYWTISQNAHDDRDKILALEHYLDCHKKLCGMLGLETALQSFFGNENNFAYDDHAHDKNGRHYNEGETVYKEGSSPYVYHSDEYIRRSNEGLNGNGNGNDDLGP